MITQSFHFFPYYQPPLTWLASHFSDTIRSFLESHVLELLPFQLSLPAPCCQCWQHSQATDLTQTALPNMASFDRSIKSTSLRESSLNIPLFSCLPLPINSQLMTSSYLRKRNQPWAWNWESRICHQQAVCDCAEVSLGLTSLSCEGDGEVGGTDQRFPECPVAYHRVCLEVLWEGWPATDLGFSFNNFHL